MTDGAPILLAGAGRLGGALIAGWRTARFLVADELLIFDPAPGHEARSAEAAGAVLDPSPSVIASARTVFLAMKPQTFRQAAAELAPLLAAEAVVVSLLAGVGLEAVGRAFPGRSVARAMPTTAIAVRKGPISVVAADARALERARCFLAPVGEVVELGDDAMMDAATAASGSGPAYVYAFVEALAAAGAAAGLPERQAARLARSTVIGAAGLLEASDHTPAALRGEVTSPGGTTEAGLRALGLDDGLAVLVRGAVAAAAARARALGLR